MNAAVKATMRLVRWLGTSRTATMQANGKPKPDPNEKSHRRRDCGVASAQSRRAILHLPRQPVVCHSDCAVRTLKGYLNRAARHLLRTLPISTTVGGYTAIVSLTAARSRWSL
jgi:hypothetical protein